MSVSLDTGNRFRGFMVKKILVSIVCIASLAVLGLVGYGIFKSESGLDSINPADMMWVKCRVCGVDYEISVKSYYGFQEANKQKMAIQPMTCDKCGKDGVYKAVKYEECQSAEQFCNPVAICPERRPFICLFFQIK